MEYDIQNLIVLGLFFAGFLPGFFKVGLPKKTHRVFFWVRARVSEPCKSDIRSVSLVIRMAGIRFRTNRWFTLTKNLPLRGRPPTNHFCTDR